jgi:hypothetical protein
MVFTRNNSSKCFYQGHIDLKVNQIFFNEFLKKLFSQFIFIHHYLSYYF